MRLRIFLTVLLAGALVTSSTAAHADEAPAPAWYGWQIMASDAAFLTVGILGEEVNDEVAWGVAAPGLVLAPAGIHLAHGRGKAALGSLALRVGLGALGVAIASTTCEAEDSDEDSLGLGCLDSIPTGAGLGILTAAAIDAIFLSTSDGRAPATARESTGIGLAPRPGGVTLSFGGTF